MRRIFWLVLVNLRSTPKNRWAAIDEGALPGEPQPHWLNFHGQPLDSEVGSKKGNVISAVTS